MPGSPELLSCSFCGSRQQHVKLLIAGAHGYICDGCMGRAHAVIAEPGHTVSTPVATIQQVSAEAAAEQCSFCAKQRYQVAAMASADGMGVICDECLALCDEILREAPPKLPLVRRDATRYPQ